MQAAERMWIHLFPEVHTVASQSRRVGAPRFRMENAVVVQLDICNTYYFNSLLSKPITLIW